VQCAIKLIEYYAVLTRSNAVANILLVTINCSSLYSL